MANLNKKSLVVSPGAMNKGPGGGVGEGRARAGGKAMKNGNCGGAHGELVTKVETLERDFHEYKEELYDQQISPLWDEVKSTKQKIEDIRLELVGEMEKLEKRQGEVIMEVKDSVKSFKKTAVGFLISVLLLLLAQTNIIKSKDGQPVWMPYWMQEGKANQQMTPIYLDPLATEQLRNLIMENNNER